MDRETNRELDPSASTFAAQAAKNRRECFARCGIFFDATRNGGCSRLFWSCWSSARLVILGTTTAGSFIYTLF